jgi:hypothetical protein
MIQNASAGYATAGTADYSAAAELTWLTWLILRTHRSYRRAYIYEHHRYYSTLPSIWNNSPNLNLIY